jgi:predicted aspartyl protease
MRHIVQRRRGRAGGLSVAAQNYPRITIAIDGKPIDMLFDTGAPFTTNERSAPSFWSSDGVEA